MNRILLRLLALEFVRVGAVLIVLLAAISLGEQVLGKWVTTVVLLFVGTFCIGFIIGDRMPRS